MPRSSACRLRRYAVELDPETEAIATIGVKEGISHLALALVDKGDAALVPNPTYPWWRTSSGPARPSRGSSAPSSPRRPTPQQEYDSTKA